MAHNATSKPSSRVPHAISIQFRAPSNDKYGIMVIPQRMRHFFREGYKVPFDLHTGRLSTRAWLTSAPRGTPIGTDAGAYLVGGLQRVFAAHTDWTTGMWANFKRRDDHVFLTVTRHPRFQHEP